MCADTPLRIGEAAEESAENGTPSALIRLLRRLERSKGLDPVVGAVEPFFTVRSFPASPGRT